MTTDVMFSCSSKIITAGEENVKISAETTVLSASSEVFHYAFIVYLIFIELYLVYILYQFLL